MAKRNLYFCAAFLLFFFLAAPSFSATVNIRLDIQFGTGFSHIYRKDYKTVKGLAQLHKRFPHAEMFITGHTDRTGRDEVNQELSEARAATIKMILSKYGVNPALMHSRGYGEKAPIGDNFTPGGRAQNRRVVATFYGLTNSEARSIAYTITGNSKYKQIAKENKLVERAVASLAEQKKEKLNVKKIKEGALIKRKVSVLGQVSEQDEANTKENQATLKQESQEAQKEYRLEKLAGAENKVLESRKKQYIKKVPKGKFYKWSQLPYRVKKEFIEKYKRNPEKYVKLGKFLKARRKRLLAKKRQLQLERQQQQKVAKASDSKPNLDQFFESEVKKEPVKVVTNKRKKTRKRRKLASQSKKEKALSRYFFEAGTYQNVLDAVDRGSGVRAEWLGVGQYNLGAGYQIKFKDKYWFGLEGAYLLQNYEPELSPQYTWDEKSPGLLRLSLSGDYEIDKFGLGLNLNFNQENFIYENLFNVILKKVNMFGLSGEAKYKWLSTKGYSSRAGVFIEKALFGSDEINPKGGLGYTAFLDFSKHKVFSKYDLRLRLYYGIRNFTNDENDQEETVGGISLRLTTPSWL